MKIYMVYYEKKTCLENKDLITSGTNLNVFLYSIAAMRFCLTIPCHPTLTMSKLHREKKIGNQARFALNQKKEMKLVSKG